MAAKLPQLKSKPLSNAQLNNLVQMQAGKIQQLEDGKAVLIAYEIHCFQNQFGS